MNSNEIKELLLQLPKRSIDNEQAINILRINQGLTPIYIKPEGAGKVIWLDVGNYQFVEKKFSYSLDKIVAEGSSPQLLETNLDLLSSDTLAGETCYPTGFVFFVHRCGSTLLAKSLARSNNHIVINEGTALYEGIWAHLTQNWHNSISATPENLNLIRNLILALGRSGAAHQKSYFVKFNPWHSVFMDVITAAFPDVPCLFLYRDSAEILVSVTKVPAPIMSSMKGTQFSSFLTGLRTEKTKEMSDVAYFARLYRQFMLAALNFSGSNRIHYLNYDQLQAHNLEIILNRGFRHHVPSNELALMQSQFSYYSKDDSGKTRFSSDKALKRKAVTLEMRQATEKNDLLTLYQALELSDKNLFPPQNATL